MLTPTDMKTSKGENIKGYAPDQAVLLFDPGTGDALY
jgi:hypothetical protein